MTLEILCIILTGVFFSLDTFHLSIIAYFELAHTQKERDVEYVLISYPNVIATNSRCFYLSAIDVLDSTFFFRFNCESDMLWHTTCGGSNSVKNDKRFFLCLEMNVSIGTIQRRVLHISKWKGKSRNERLLYLDQFVSLRHSNAMLLNAIVDFSFIPPHQLDAWDNDFQVQYSVDTHSAP